MHLQSTRVHTLTTRSLDRTLIDEHHCPPLTRQEMEEHIKHCSKIPCPFGYAGCSYRGSQTEVLEHADRDCALKPISAFIAYADSRWKKQHEQIETLLRENTYVVRCQAARERKRESSLINFGRDTCSASCESDWQRPMASYNGPSRTSSSSIVRHPPLDAMRCDETRVDLHLSSSSSDSFMDRGE